MNCKLALPLILLAAGCSGREAEPPPEPDVPVWTEETRWRLSDTPELVIEAAPPRERAEGRPLDPVTVFRLADGRYVVADGSVAGWQALLVYGADGAFQQQLGRKGDGPAEFRQLNGWAGPYRGDSIAGLDNALQRLQVWTPDGTFGRTVSLPRGLVNMLADGRYVARADPQMTAEQWRRRRGIVTAERVLYDVDGNPVRTLASKQHDLADVPRDGQNAPDYRSREIVRTGRSNLYVAESSEFSVTVYDTLGTVVRTLRRSLPREPFTDADREEIIRIRLEWAGMGWEAASGEQMSDLEKGLRRDAKWPEFRYAIQDVLEDDEGNAWVQHYHFLHWPNASPPSPRPLTWSVFDPAGTFLGEVVVPPGFDVKNVAYGRVMGIWHDEMDVQHIHVYHLER